MEIKRRDFLKYMGLVIACPTQLLEGKVVDILDIGLEFPSGVYKVRPTIWKITAQKYVPEIYGFHFQAEGMTYVNYKEHFDKAREYLKRSQLIIEFDTSIIYDMIVGDMVTLEIPDKRMDGEYKIIKIEERPTKRPTKGRK